MREGDKTKRGDGGKGRKRGKKGGRKKGRSGGRGRLPRRRSGYHRRSASVRLNELQECETEKIGALLFSEIEDNSSVCLQLHRVSKHRCVNNAPRMALHK